MPRGSACLTCGHVIGCFGVWYRNDQRESMFTRASARTYIAGHSDDSSCKRVFAVSRHEYRDARTLLHEGAFASRPWHVEREMEEPGINTPPITKRPTKIDDGGSRAEFERSPISITRRRRRRRRLWRFARERDGKSSATRIKRDSREISREMTATITIMRSRIADADGAAS